MNATMMQMALAAREGARESAVKIQLLTEVLTLSNIPHSVEGRNVRIPVTAQSDGKSLDLMVNWQFVMPGLCNYPSYEAWLDVRGTEEEVRAESLGYDDPKKLYDVDEIVTEAKRLNTVADS